MVRHAPIVDSAGRLETSAEPLAWPAAALRICSETVLVEFVADVPYAEGEFTDARAYAETIGRHTRAAVCEAALEVERAVQTTLQPVAGAKLPLHVARRLWDAQWQAHSAVWKTFVSRVAAKEIQRTAAEGHRPLTVCVGYRYRELSTKTLSKVAPDLLGCYVPLGDGDGCGLVIPDSVEPRAPKHYCERCRARHGVTPNAGLQKRAVARLRASRRP
jgi:hypothetical protein